MRKAIIVLMVLCVLTSSGCALLFSNTSLAEKNLSNTEKLVKENNEMMAELNKPERVQTAKQTRNKEFVAVAKEILETAKANTQKEGE